MIQVAAVALAVVLARFLVAASVLGVHPMAAHFASAVLAVAVGAGLLGRPRLHVLAYGLALALLVPMCPLFVDLVQALIPPGNEADGLAVLVSLAPPGFVLGRLLAFLLQGSAVTAALGWVVGEAAALAGSTAWLPGSFTGFLVGGTMAGLVEMGRLRRQHRDAGSLDTPASWEALPLGMVLAVAWLSVRRVAPAYASPPVDAGAEVSLALMAPALLVAWPAAVLAAGRDLARRGLLAVGCLALGYALWKLALGLGIYNHNSQFVALSSTLRQTASKHGPLVTEWRAWLMVFSGLTAAAAGLVVGSLCQPAAGPFLLGLGLGLASEVWVVWSPYDAPQQLLIVAAGVAVMATLGTWKRPATLLVPAGALALLLFPEQERAAFESVRRVGEPAAESFERTLPADVLVFSAYGPHTPHPAAQRAYRQTFTDRVPLPELLDLRGEALGDHTHSHEDAQAPSLLIPEEDEAPLPRHFGIRVAGSPLHPDSDPRGVEGSTGRLVRLLARPGPAFVTGLGAELLAADLLDSGLTQQLVTSSPVPLGDRNQRVLLTQEGSRHFALEVDPDPFEAARSAQPQGFATVLVAPEPAELPGSGRVVTVEYFERISRLLQPGGRCLVWLDARAMTSRALRARVAAFGAVFGEQSFCLLEMQAQGPPLLLLAGWMDQAGRPRADELAAQLPWQDSTGVRSRLGGLDDLGAMLLRDGRGMVEAAEDWPHHRRRSPVTVGAGGVGWDAVGAVVDPAADPALVWGGPPPPKRAWKALLDGLRAHLLYDYDPAPMAGAMLTEIVSDVDWAAFDVEVGHYARAAAEDPQNPLLHLALASLLSPLVQVGDFGRFARAFEAVGGERMDSWRLAALQARVLEAGLEPERAAQAMARARALAGWSSSPED